MGCGCGGSTYGMAENPPDQADPFYWNGTTPAPKPEVATPKTPKK